MLSLFASKRDTSFPRSRKRFVSLLTTSSSPPGSRYRLCTTRTLITDDRDRQMTQRFARAGLIRRASNIDQHSSHDEAFPSTSTLQRLAATQTGQRGAEFEKR